jgi:hypothetical protein
MTVGELKKMSLEEKAALYDGTRGNNSPDAINTETNTMEDIINTYAKTEILLDDMEDLQKELLAVVA